MAMHLANAISYITEEEKTQFGSLVGSHNCNVDSALQEMLATKRKFGKMDKRQGYHFIISFKKQEVRPETAMEITQKFVERYFGDDFQCLYVTHDNTEHVHSHILFNCNAALYSRQKKHFIFDSINTITEHSFR